jgi:hypothetical protein
MRVNGRWRWGPGLFLVRTGVSRLGLGCRDSRGVGEWLRWVRGPLPRVGGVALAQDPSIVWTRTRTQGLLQPKPPASVAGELLATSGVDGKSRTPLIPPITRLDWVATCASHRDGLAVSSQSMGYHGPPAPASPGTCSRLEPLEQSKMAPETTSQVSQVVPQIAAFLSISSHFHGPPPLHQNPEVPPLPLDHASD